MLTLSPHNLHLIILLVCMQCVIAELPWKVWPYAMIPNDSNMTFPAAEALHSQYHGDSWFVTGELQGIQSNTTYHFATIFDHNLVADVVFNFYQASIFSLNTGVYSSYTEYDISIFNKSSSKLHCSDQELSLSFQSLYGKATWTHPKFKNGSSIPFMYQVYLPGVDKQGHSFLIDLTINPIKYPSPYGGRILNGTFTFYDQPNTLSWFQTGLQFNGTAVWGNTTESVVGNSQLFQYNAIVNEI